MKLSISSLTKVFSGVIVVAVLIAGFTTFVPKVKAALTQVQVDAIISLLQSFGADASTVANVQTSLTGGTPTGGTETVAQGSYNFGTVLLKVGSKGTAVMELQRFLNAYNNAGLTVDGVAGPMTGKAIKAWQTTQGLTADSLFGKDGRKAAYAQAGGTTPTPGDTNPVTGGSVTATLASDNPSGMVLASGSSNNTVLKFNIGNGTASDVNVTTLKLTKTGFLASTNVSGVGVYAKNDAGAWVRHGNVVTTLGADGVAIMTLSSSPIVVKAGKSVTVAVKVNLCQYTGCTGSTTYTGTVGFNVNSAADITLSSGTATVATPVAGNVMSIVDGSTSLAIVRVDVQPVNSSGATLNVDPANSQEITKFRIQETSSNEDLKLYDLTLWNNGTAAAADYKDVELVDQTGLILATAQPTASGVQFTLATPYSITKGQTKDFTIKAKIIDGAARTLQLVIYNDYDVDVRGVNTGATILPTPLATNDTGTSFPVGDQNSTYNTVTVGSGSLVFNRSSDSPSSAVTPGASSVVLARYDVKPIGEDMELRTINFGITNTAASLTGTVFVTVDGSTVYSAAMNTTNFATAGTVASRNLSSYPIIKSGVKSILEVVASVATSATSTSSVMVNDFDITSRKRLITNDIGDPSVGTADGLARSINAASLTITNLATPIATSLIAGTAGAELANIQFSTIASGEDARISTLVIADTKSATATYATVSNLVLKNSAGEVVNTSNSTATNAATVSFTISSPIIVAKGTTATYKLYGDVSGTATGTHLFFATSTGGSVTGKDTGNTVTPTFAGSGQTMTIATNGSMSLSLVSGTNAAPSVAQLVNVGSTNESVFAFRLSSLFEAQKISALRLTWSGTTASTTDIKNIRLYKNAETTAFASAEQADNSCASSTCTYAWTWSDNWGAGSVQPGSPMTIYVKADIGTAGIARLGHEYLFKIAATTDASSTGAYSAVVSTVTGTPTVTATSTIVPFKVTAEAVSPAPGSAITQVITVGSTLGQFKVAAPSGGSAITLNQVKFIDSGSNSSANTMVYGLYASNQGAGASNGTLITTTTRATSTNVVTFGTSASTSALTINAGSYRNLFITYETAGTSAIASGDSFKLSVAALGDITYNVTELNLGYDENNNGDLADAIIGLKADGIPILGTLQKT